MTVLPIAVASPEHGQSPCSSRRFAPLPPRSAAAADAIRRRAAAAPDSPAGLGSAARCGAKGCLVCGMASNSRAWLPETLAVHEECGSVDGWSGVGGATVTTAVGGAASARARTIISSVQKKTKKPLGVGTEVPIRCDPISLSSTLK